MKRIENKETLPIGAQLGLLLEKRLLLLEHKILLLENLLKNTRTQFSKSQRTPVSQNSSIEQPLNSIENKIYFLNSYDNRVSNKIKELKNERLQQLSRKKGILRVASKQLFEIKQIFDESVQEFEIFCETGLEYPGYQDMKNSLEKELEKEFELCNSNIQSEEISKESKEIVNQSDKQK